MYIFYGFPANVNPRLQGGTVPNGESLYIYFKRTLVFSHSLSNSQTTPCVRFLETDLYIETFYPGIMHSGL